MAMHAMIALIMSLAKHKLNVICISASNNHWNVCMQKPLKVGSGVLM